ncbi:MAG: hypothetical protein WCG27_04515 [Pseudomonadota bacterium]
MVEDYYRDAEITFEDGFLKIDKEFGYKADSWSGFRRVVAKNSNKSTWI